MRIYQVFNAFFALLIATWPFLGLAADSGNLGTSRVGPTTPLAFPNSEAAVQFVLKDLQQLGQSLDRNDEIYARSLGFLSAAEAASAQVGTEVRSYVVPYNQLKNFNPGDDPDKLLIDTREIIVPILVQGVPRSSLTLGELTQEKIWQIRKKGRANLVRLIERYRTSDKNALVVISKLGLKFLSERTKGKLMLIPLQNSATLKLEAGQPVLAQDLFVQLGLHVQALMKRLGTVQPE